ncbi:Fungal trans domain containing protein [Pyrenophora teres f. maculata]|nr:Fungal trans domain containing protein [Pyrenophora teres f. maculata]
MNASEAASPMPFEANRLQIDESSNGSNHDSVPASLAGALEATNAAAWAWSTNGGYAASIDNMAPPGLGLLDTNWLSPQYRDPADMDAFLMNLANGTHDNVEHWACPAALTTPEQEATVTIQPPLHTNLTNLNTTPSTWNATSMFPSKASRNRYYVDGTGARAPFGGKTQDSNSSESTQLHETEANIPNTPDEIFEAISLCPPEAYRSLLDGIATERNSGLVEIEPSDLPTQIQICICVGHYFEKFHPVFPFLRRSSFAHDASNNWHLLLAVAVVGSKYMYHSPNSQLKASLHRLLSLILTRYKYGLESVGEVNDADADYIPGCTTSNIVCPKLSMIQAGILNIVCLLHSGKKLAMEQAFVNRHYLIEACHTMELLANTTRFGSLIDLTRSGPDHIDSAWLAKESRVRTGMMIWTLDTLFVYEFQAKPLMRLDDIDAVLPCHEDIWEQPSSMQQGRRTLTNMTLAKALEILYVEKKLPPHLGTFSTGLLISAICQNTKDILTRDRIRLNSWTPTALPQDHLGLPSVHQEWLPRTQLASKWRNSACDCLDILHWPANGTTARNGGFENHIILQLHLARLLILVPVDSVQIFAAAYAPDGYVASGENHGQELATARFKVMQWAVQDHCKARLALVHCGALFWHVRRYSSGSPLEPYAVYIATLILWAFCACMKVPGAVEAIDPESQDAPDPSFLHLDRPLDDELVQTYVQVGHKMSAYIANVGSLEATDAPTRIAKEGALLLAKHSSMWGIERSYTRLLSLLSGAP